MICKSVEFCHEMEIKKDTGHQDATPRNEGTSSLRRRVTHIVTASGHGRGQSGTSLLWAWGLAFPGGGGPQVILQGDVRKGGKLSSSALC